MASRISSTFDGGAIEVVADADPRDLQVGLRADSHADFRQWFYFRLQGAQAQPTRVRFVNAGAATYVTGWRDYHAVASYDRVDWFRVPTTFDGSELTIAHTPLRDSIYYAYFEPYSWDRHLALLGRADDSPRARVRDLGATVEGRDLNLVTVGTAAAGRKSLWVIARQHPGETMAEWFVEGMLERLLDPADPVARRILERAVVHIVPNMNPDGSVRGNLRTNAAGANLNREWMAPSMGTSPEVFLVRQRIQQTGADIFLDAHGDEGLPYVFVAGCEMVPGFTPEQGKVQGDFIEHYKRASPDFQSVHGYSAGKYQTDALKLASKWVGHTYGCLSLTLEMPFKDNADLPDPEFGWSGERSRKLGAAILQPLLAALPK